MAYIIETPNAFQPLVGMRKHFHPGGISIRGWLEGTYPGFIEFPNPTICLVNGEPVLREDWDQEIKKDDIVNFINLVGGPLIIIVVVLIIAMVALALTMQPPATPGTTPSSDPVFSTKGQTNDIRLGEPIEVNYGRNRIYPSLASYPFFRYVDNDQFQYSLFCIGQGFYEVHAIQVGDTDINTFAEVTYELLQPGEASTLFWSNIETSVEVGGQTFYATNDPEYEAPGWIGPFAVCGPDETVSAVEVDLVYPKGVYRVKKNGSLAIITVRVEFEKRLIDDDGNPLGDWSSLITYSMAAATTTPQRRTSYVALSPGRYEVRGRNPDFQPISTRYGRDVAWESMKGYLIRPTPDYGNITMLAVKIRATNNLNARTQERFNVLATRKLPVRESGGTFSDPVATRSIIWAFVDVFRSFYGGYILSDTFFDWETLETLDALYESRNEHFDWTFRDPITVWEAAKVIARAGRAIPLLAGSLITMRRDGPLEVPVTLFMPDNIVRGSFEWSISLWEPLDFDSLMVEYNEPASGYKQEQVLCILPGDSGDIPKDLRIPGIQDRDHAYHEGLYTLASERYLRENIAFETGLEGFIPSYGDLVAISHDVPRWGQSGYILGVEEESSGTCHLHVSEPLDFSESGDHQILLRKKDGSIIGPFTAQENSDPKIVTIEPIEEIDFLLGGTTEPMLFLFGVIGEITKYGRVVKLEPQGGERVKITLVNEAPIIHTFDELIAPPFTAGPQPPVVPDLPIITRLTLTQVDDSVLQVLASWNPAFGAQFYIIQTSTDGVNWQFRADTVRTSLQFQVTVGLLYVRVAAVNNGQGPWIQGTIDVGRIFGLVIFMPWNADLESGGGNDLEWGIRWWSNPLCDAYRIRVYDNAQSAPILKREVIQTGVEFIYSFDSLEEMAIDDDNLNRLMLVEVDGMSRDSDTDILEADNFPRTLELSNVLPLPPADSSISWEFVSYDEDASAGPTFYFRIYWADGLEADLYRGVVWLSLDASFDPTLEPSSYSFVSSTVGSTPQQGVVGIVLTPDHVFPDTYLWVGLGDIWGPEGAPGSQFVITLDWILEPGTWTDLNRWIDQETWKDA